MHFKFLILSVLLLTTINEVHAKRKGSGIRKDGRVYAVEYIGNIKDLKKNQNATRGPDPLIVGGKKAPKKLRKHLAHVIIVDVFGDVYGCSGTVVGKKYVLTAAHCFDSYFEKSESFVLIAEKSTGEMLFTWPDNKYFMKNVYVHYRFSFRDYLENDVALVELDEDLSKKLYKPIKFGSPPEESFTKIEVAGYGLKGSDKKKPKRVSLGKVLFQEWGVCYDELGFHLGNSESHEFCYTSLQFPDKGKTGTCSGDSGGPVLKKDGRKYVQIGIISYYVGEKCESPGTIMVAQNLQKYKKMISNKVMKNKNKGWKKL
ncbi:Tryptase [Gracilariopsis chorda]|uniref:Tryptase n=1 Tax=Gracilariopsis chorda TaxID=448386 RepID=A0A2V3IV79_9FLOR|nr:Tryptase [Gracilariopsis chorda]|eukprot:PXF46032.1 Tryptase [Gracilariopsis chorda]